MQVHNFMGLAITAISLNLVGGSIAFAETASLPSSLPLAAADGDLKSRISAAMLAGRCEDAKEMAIKANEFDLAEQVVRLCSPKAEVNRSGNVQTLNSGNDLKKANDLFNRKQYYEAYEIYNNLSESGDADSANQIGLMLQSGLGLPKDEKRALSYFKIAADRGSLWGYYNLGYLHLKGILVQRNYSESIRYFKYAADRNHAESQNYMGLIYANGYGVKKDLKVALNWYKIAASNGSSFARQNISGLIDIGAASEADLVIPNSGNHEPDWKRRPTIEQIATFYPKPAVLERVTGKVIVHCEVGTGGQVEECDIVSEDPTGYGFGSAGLKLARISEFTPKIVEGKAVKGEIRIPFNFTLPESMFNRLIKALNSTN